MKVKREREVAQSYLTLSDPMDCSLPGSFVHRIFQARVLEWGAIAFYRQPIMKWQEQCQEFRKEVATHSSILAWKIPETGEPGGLPSVGSHRVGHD